ncbi:MAG: ArnT family glycosyltransferase [Burkholderiales bacterium]
MSGKNPVSPVHRSLFISTEELPGTRTPRLPLYLLLWLIWILPGLIGHDPWKPDEAENIGVVYQMLQSGEWLVPALAGEPYLVNPPFVHWAAAGLAALFSPPLELHDAARLAAGLFMAATLLFTAAAAREFFGRGFGWVAAMALVGCLGLLVRGHLLVPELATLAGFALTLFGVALAPSRAIWGGIAIGCGIGVAFMGSGILIPLSLIIAILLAPMFLYELRDVRVGIAIFIALLALMPWLLAWPYALYERSPQLFNAWFWEIEIGQFLPRPGVSIATSHFVAILPWFAWPVWPLALWTLWRGHPSVWQRPGVLLPLIVFAVLLALLSLSQGAGESDALPLLVSLSLIAAASIDTLRRGAFSALDWFGIMTFGLIAGFLWLGWIALLTGEPAQVADWLRGFGAELKVVIDYPALIFSVVVTLAWIALVWRIGRGSRRALVNWAAGITLIWLLAMALWLPFVDSMKSYRWTIASLRESLPEGCVATSNLGSSQRAMLHYFGGIVTEREGERLSECDLLLVQSRNGDPSTPSGWSKIWEGSRQNDRDERFRLYQKQD